MKRVPDLVSLVGGVVLLVVCGFFLLADDPSLDDVGRVLLPVTLLVAGGSLVLGSLRRRDEG